MKLRFNKLLYTIRHKKAFLLTEKELIGSNTLRGYLHDIDKIFMLLFCFHKTHKEIQNIHRTNQRHHIENKKVKNEVDFTEMIIDWECARITKPDKPLNAYDTLYKYYPQLENEILPLLKKYKIDYSNTIKETKND